jgi:hypothetical protein
MDGWHWDSEKFIPLILNFTLQILNPMVYDFQRCTVQLTFAEQLGKCKRQ